MSKLFTLLAGVLIFGFAKSATVRGSRRLWGPTVTTEEQLDSMGSDPWDQKDLKDIDQTEEERISGGGMMYETFKPAGGYVTPVGEQAGCILDKAAHLMNFHSCNSIVMPDPNDKAPYKPSIIADHPGLKGVCKNMKGNVYTSTKVALNKCCEGSDHIPLWSSMKTCAKRVAPIVNFLHTHESDWATCLALYSKCDPEEILPAVSGDPKSHPHKSKCAHAAFKSKSCRTAAEVVPSIVSRIFKTAATLFVESHKLDVNPMAKKFMLTCDPTDAVKAEASAKFTRNFYFNHACEQYLSEMLEKSEEHAGQTTKEPSAADDDGDGDGDDDGN